MPWRCRTTSASRRNRKTAENLSAVFSCRRAFYAFAGWVLTTAISRDTGAILRSIYTMPQYFSCVSSSARPTFAWSSSELHSTL